MPIVQGHAGLGLIAKDCEKKNSPVVYGGFFRYMELKITSKSGNSLESATFYGALKLSRFAETIKENFPFPREKKKSKQKMSELIEGFLEYSRYEKNFSPQTIVKYRDSLRCFMRAVGDKEVEDIDLKDFITLKRFLLEKGVGESRIASVVYGMKSFLGYCQRFLKLSTLDPNEIRPPKRPRREVIFLTKEEIDRFTDTMDVRLWREFRFRVLVEVLLGTGMRIGEVLSLNRRDIYWEKKEAKIIGKGNKERRIFFTDRSLYWLKKYLDWRKDDHEAVFVTRTPINRMARDDIWRFFARHKRLAGIEKKITPHILRHTVATNLVFNGCPLVHVKEILGHERLDTTCKYYLGVDKEQAKKAHQQYLNFVS